MFRATQSVDPRLLPHVPPVTAEKEDDPTIVQKQPNAQEINSLSLV